jgi:long-chain fatty acid transport protein
MRIFQRYLVTRLFCFLGVILLTTCVSAQQVKPEPTFRLLDSGYGAAALGIGGAFTAVANDLSAIYWNPAGLAQLTNIELHVDWRYMTDSREDFSAMVFPNRFDSEQRYEITGNQFQSIAGSYTFHSRKFVFVPAFAWQRNSTLGPTRDLKEAAGLVQFTNPQRIEFFQSQGLFSEEFKGGEDELAFGLGTGFWKSFLIGFSWNFIIGGPEAVLTGNFDDTQVTPDVTHRQLISLNQSTNESASGNYFKIGVLFKAGNAFNAGGYVRTPYTRKADIDLSRTGTIVADGISGTINEHATAKSEINVPTEWGGGVAFTARSVTFAGSVTYADWKDVQQIVTDSSNILLIPETILPFPTLRPNAGFQTSLLQWRIGAEYASPQLRTGGGLALRTGYFWDSQPYGNIDPDRVYFKGYSFGLGFVARTFRIDAAYISEKGDLQFSPEDTNASDFKNRRWQFSATFLSP